MGLEIGRKGRKAHKTLAKLRRLLGADEWKDCLVRTLFSGLHICILPASWLSYTGRTVYDHLSPSVREVSPTLGEVHVLKWAICGARGGENERHSLLKCNVIYFDTYQRFART